MADVILAKKCFRIIEDEGYECALVGGVAVGVWAGERLTKDLDFALAVKNDKDAESLVKKMLNKGFSVEKMLEHKPTNSLSVVILSSPKIGKIQYRVDLIFVQSGIEKEIVDKALVTKEGKNITLRVASVGHLIAQKILSMHDDLRPQDRSDLKNLISIADKNDIELAKKSIDLITKRGFNQKKDLEQKLNVMLEIYTQKVPSPRLKR